MKNLIKMVTTTILAVSSVSAIAAFDINDISTAGFYVQNQLNSGYGATANSNDHFLDSKTGQDVYPIDIEVNDSSETFLATVLVTIDDEGNVAKLRCNKTDNISLLTKLGITCGGTYTVKSGFFTDLAKMGFAAANENANQRHIEAVLDIEDSKAYTMFAGDVYIKAGGVIVDVPLNKIKGKTDKQIQELIMDAVRSELSVINVAGITSKIQLELRAIAEEAARQAAKQVAEISQELVKGSDAWVEQIARKVEADCIGIGGAFSEQARGSWSCIGGTHPE